MAAAPAVAEGRVYDVRPPPDRGHPPWLTALDNALPTVPIRDWSLCWDPRQRSAAGFRGADFFLMPHLPPASHSGEEAHSHGTPASRAAVRVYHDAPANRVHAAVRFGTCAEGSPGLAHGGCVATVWDEVLNVFNLLQRVPRFTASLHVDYRAPTPLCETHRVEAWVEEGNADGRKLVTRGRMLDGATGQLLSEARAVWVAVPEAASAADGKDSGGGVSAAATTEPHSPDRTGAVLSHLFTHPPTGPPIEPLADAHDAPRARM